MKSTIYLREREIRGSAFSAAIADSGYSTGVTGRWTAARTRNGPDNKKPELMARASCLANTGGPESRTRHQQIMSPSAYKRSSSCDDYGFLTRLSLNEEQWQLRPTTSNRPKLPFGLDPLIGCFVVLTSCRKVATKAGAIHS